MLKLRLESLLNEKKVTRYRLSKENRNQVSDN